MNADIQDTRQREAQGLFRERLCQKTADRAVVLCIFSRADQWFRKFVPLNRPFLVPMFQALRPCLGPHAGAGGGM